MNYRCEDKSLCYIWFWLSEVNIHRYQFLSQVYLGDLYLGQYIWALCSLLRETVWEQWGRLADEMCLSTKLTTSVCLWVRITYEDNVGLSWGTIGLQCLHRPGFSSSESVCVGWRPTVGTRRYLLEFGWGLVAEWVRAALWEVCVCVRERRGAEGGVKTGLVCSLQPVISVK